jgi:hypothetical protein
MEVNYEVADLIAKSNCGTFVNVYDKIGLKIFILSEYNRGVYKNEISDLAKQYSRKALTKKMADILDNLN